MTFPKTAVRVLCAGALSVSAAEARPAQGPQTVAAFNQRLESATRDMNMEALSAMWDNDGVSLLPGTAPLVGKPAIDRFLTDTTADLKGVRMEAFTMRCSGLQQSGSWASEWCAERQQLRTAEGKPIESMGRLLLVLHRGTDGVWRLSREMWNQGSA